MTAVSRRQCVMNEIEKTFDTMKRSKPVIDDKEPMKRTILLIGRPRSGKTTLKNMIENPMKVSDEMSLVSQFNKPECKQIKCENSALFITVVDTPGLSNCQNDNDELRQIHKTCIEGGIIGFHLVCFCTSFDAGINRQDIDLLKRITEYFGETIKPNLCMIITRCESKGVDQQNRIRTEVEKDAFFAKVVDRLGQGIRFSGSLNYDDWYRGNDALFDQFTRVYGYREELLGMIEAENNVYRLPKVPESSIHTSIELPSHQPQTKHFVSIGEPPFPYKYVLLIDNAPTRSIVSIPECDTDFPDYVFVYNLMNQ